LYLSMIEYKQYAAAHRANVLGPRRASV
jgi:hypothetical protein